MKIRKSLNNQMDFLSDEKDSVQWDELTLSTHEKIKHLLSQLFLSTVCQNDRTIKEDHHAKNYNRTFIS